MQTGTKSVNEGASRQSAVDYFILGHILIPHSILARKMLGKQAICCENKVAALACDDNLYLKPTKAGKAYLGDPTEAAPFWGAKLWYFPL